MSELPKGWLEATVGDTGEYVNGYAFQPSDWSDRGRPIIRIQNLTDPEKPINRTETQVPERYIVRTGDLLVSWSATLDAFIWNREEALLNQHIFRVLPDERLVSRGYLFYLLKQLISEMLKTEHLHGSTMKHINRGPFMAHGAAIAPRSEQDRIVAEIEKQFSRLDAATAALKRVQANLKRYRASVLKAACEGRLVPTEAELTRKESREYEPADRLLERILRERRARWEADTHAKIVASGKPPKDDRWKQKYKEPSAPDTANLSDLPEGWAWTTLEQLSFIQGGITKGQKRRVGDKLKLVPYLRVANVQRGFLDLTEVKQIEATEDEIEELTLLRNDILFNEGGDRDKLGRGWIWESQIPSCIHQNHVFRARLAVPDVEPRYVSSYANAFGQQYFFDEGKHTTNLASLSMTKLKALPIPLPPVAEQVRIVEAMTSLGTEAERQGTAATIAMKKSESLRRAILESAFSGQLVSQDPTEEPASVLLERIRTERAVSAFERASRTRRTGHVYA
jgi:type I restriction enzyme, S subunit